MNQSTTLASNIMPKSKESFKRVIKINCAISSFNASLGGMAFWILMGFHEAAILASLVKLSGIACNCISGKLQKKHSKTMSIEQAIELSFKLELINLFFYGLGNIVLCYHFETGMIMLCIGRILYGFYEAFTGIKLEHLREFILEPGAENRAEWNGEIKASNSFWTTIGTIINMGAFWYMEKILGMTGVQPYHVIIMTHGFMVAIDLCVSIYEYNMSKLIINTLERNR